jgi:hypothetical protein
MDENPIVIAATRCQSGKRVGNGRGARIAAAA